MATVRLGPRQPDPEFSISSKVVKRERPSPPAVPTDALLLGVQQEAFPAPS